MKFQSNFGKKLSEYSEIEKKPEFIIFTIVLADSISFKWDVFQLFI